MFCSVLFLDGSLVLDALFGVQSKAQGAKLTPHQAFSTAPLVNILFQVYKKMFYILFKIETILSITGLI